MNDTLTYGINVGDVLMCVNPPNMAWHGVLVHVIDIYDDEGSQRIQIKYLRSEGIIEAPLGEKMAKDVNVVYNDEIEGWLFGFVMNLGSLDVKRTQAEMDVFIESMQMPPTVVEDKPNCYGARPPTRKVDLDTERIRTRLGNQ